MQVKAQQQLMQQAKEKEQEAQAAKLAEQQAISALEGKVNVLDIKVDDNFDIDDI